MDDKEERLVDVSTQTGVSNWLVVLLITKFGFELFKQQFWDSDCNMVGKLPVYQPVFLV